MRNTKALLLRTPSVFGTVTQRVLVIPELLELVFSFLNTQENARNARVCKAWTQVALDLLWREVDDLPRLLSLLAPTEDCTEGRRFSRPLEPNDWTRYMRYASRVRKLVVTPGIDEALKGPSVFQEIAQTRTTAHLLPKLSSLTWTPDSGERLRLSLMFMHENVKEFAARLVPSDTYAFSVYFQEIALRMPKLTRLDLRFSFPVRNIETDVCALIAALPHLRVIVMPKFTLTTKVMEALSRKEHLEVVQFEFMESQGGGDAWDVTDWAPVMEEGAFPALYDLSLNVQISHMRRFVTSPFCPAHLRLLYVNVIEIVPPPQVHAFLTALAENCPQLAELAINYSGEPHGLVFRPNPPADMLLTWDTLRPALKCAKLTLFEIHWDTPLAISQADLEDIASSWPELEVLILDCQPLPSTLPSALTLDALVPFARHCPRLRELGLYLSASAPPRVGATTTTTHPVPFKSLQRLEVGVSSIVDPGPAALFLSELCPADCRLVSGVNWPHDKSLIAAESEDDLDALRGVLAELGEFYRRWEEVRQVLPLLIRLRMEERARRDALEHEAEDLRMRCKVLEERLGMGAAGANVDGGCMIL
ncbi:hypothetical protein C8Q74DRAFT_1361745 [Fomes fomentarius]|nr:hypothetical protein C8Q74DRAFT_1361745 [Fomes fomentarius]